MTTITTTSFRGATSQGMERISGRITQGENAARATLIESTVERGETVIEIAHPSTRCYELEWERTAQYRKSESIMAWVNAIAVSLFNVVLVPAIAFCLLVAAVIFFGKSNFIVAAVAPVLFVAAGIGIGMSVVRFMRAVKARAEGHANFFVDHYVDWLALRAVAMTDKALYFTEQEKASVSVTVRRIAYVDVQTCAFSVDSGIGRLMVFGNDGCHLVIRDPRNERIRGASHLRELIIARLP